MPVELIEQIIEAGTYAPNHFRTEPWRFLSFVEKAGKD
ncbi:nitroreductase family protein [Bacillus sp. N9]